MNNTLKVTDDDDYDGGDFGNSPICIFLVVTVMRVIHQNRFQNDGDDGDAIVGCYDEIAEQRHANGTSTKSKLL